MLLGQREMQGMGCVWAPGHQLPQKGALYGGGGRKGHLYGGTIHLLKPTGALEDETAESILPRQGGDPRPREKVQQCCSCPQL